MDIAVTQYYQSPHVRARMIEFLGGSTLDTATGVYLARCDDAASNEGGLRLPGELGYFLDNGLDVSRSLWDRESLIAHLDVEYVNFDFPAEPYLDPLRAFHFQKSAMRAIESILLEFGIYPLHLLSGRGHHFVWRVAQSSPAFRQLARLGRLPRALKEYYSQQSSPRGERMSLDLAAAFSGLGLVIEYLAHRVRSESVKTCEIPVELSAVAVPPQQRGREMVSLDITEYGDPLNLRVIRVPFSVYLKPWQRSWILNDEIRSRVPLMFLIPLHEINVEEGIKLMRGDNETVELARRASVVIPEQSRAMEKMIEAYAHSNIADFHDWFYSEEHHEVGEWAATYDKTPIDSFAPCVGHILRNPNDLLLQPAGIRQVVRYLMSAGWHPRHIAGLIRSRYERDFGWGRRWYIYSAISRADFYTRVFSGMLETGQDELADFDCGSTKGKMFCFHPGASCGLEEHRERLKQRVLA